MRTIARKPKTFQPVAARGSPRIQRSEARTATPAFSGLSRVPARHAAAPAAHAVSRSPGQPLDPAPRALLEQRFQQDFGAVRVHADGHAASAAQAIGARAYTTGQDIVFGRGEYRPGTAEGTRLLAHELAHVVQQRRGVSVEGGMGRVGDAYERQADSVADAVVAGRPAGGLLSGHPIAASAGGGSAVQRQAAPGASGVAPVEEPEKLVSEGDLMREAVIESAGGRQKSEATIMSQEEIDKIRSGYTQTYTVKVDGKEETRTREVAPMKNYTTCVEFAGQTFGDAISKRSKKLGRNAKETRAASRLLSDAKRKLDAEYQLQAEIDVYTETMRLNRASLEDPKKPDRRGRKVDGPLTRLAKAVKAGEELQEKKKVLDLEEAQLADELKLLVEAGKAASESGNKDGAKALSGEIQKKKQELLVKHQMVLQTKGQMVGQAQTIKQLNTQIRGVDHERDKLKAMIDGRKAKLDEMHKHDQEIHYAKAPLTEHPKRGEYVLLGAGAAQGYGVSAATTVTLGKGAFKHIAVFDSFEKAPSPPDKPNEKWELWHTIDGGGLKSKNNAIKVCLDDLRVAPGDSKTPWFASATTLIGWIDMDNLVAGSAPSKPAGAAPPTAPSPPSGASPPPSAPPPSP
ncbi:DUF4157 domain-containing protein [Sphingomonas sp. KR3-1]|uniref:eCIS core domain-containing protein n=1 Tax=Sphingomonas sp. KR3-1 TaxID=3156611 RepID=UPI0032B47ACB